jgi:4-carboxymuconolactone decarboxylase
LIGEKSVNRALINRSYLMPRLPKISRDDLTNEARRIFDEIVESRGEVDAPFQALLHSPEVLRRTADLGAYLRFESSLPPWVRELVILTTAHVHDCRYEWTDHEPKAIEAGIRYQTLRTIEKGEVPKGLAQGEGVVVGFVLELLRSHRVNKQTFRKALDWFGTKGVTEIVATIGYYSMLAAVINAFEISTPMGRAAGSTPNPAES